MTQEPAVHELRHFDMPLFGRDRIFSMSYRALCKQPTLFQHVNDDEGKGILDNPGVLEQNVRTRLISHFGDSRILTDNYTRADPVDNIFKHVVMAGYMEEARRATLFLSLSLSLSTKAGTREKYH